MMILVNQTKVSTVPFWSLCADPFADSLAGQMHALKTGQAPSKKKKKLADADSSEESGTEEEDDDTSATNTDTDEE